MLENIYGKGPVQEEAKIVAQALSSASTRGSAHPDDRAGWTGAVPAYGHCDLYTDFCRRIWGRTDGKHWNPEAKILVWWVYANEESFKAGVRKNKLTVHYSFKHPEYGIIDLSHNQFPDKTYLYPRYPLPHSIPVGKSWNKFSEMNIRRELIEPKFRLNLLNSTLPEKMTPEFSRFLEEI